MNKKLFFIAVIALLTLYSTVLPVYAKLSGNLDNSENYYTVYGEPDLSAALIGNNEYSRGSTVTLSIGMANKGIISGFKPEKDVETGNFADEKLQQAEMQYETQAVTAVGVLATLKSDNPGIVVKSMPQEAGTLKQGKQSSSPTQFTIEINKNISAGTYPLTLELSYDYQKNTQVRGDDIDSSTGLVTNKELGIWYKSKIQTQRIEIKVKNEPRFEVAEVKGELHPGENGILLVKYKNTGEEPAKDATVRISATDPLSTTDDQAFLGTLNPGDSAVAAFNLEVEKTATPSIYSLTSEIIYEDAEGHDKVSDSIKVDTQVLPAEKNKLIGFELGEGVTFVTLAACAIVFRKKRED